MTSNRNNARFLRVAVIRNIYKQDLLTREEALELLRGPLTPGDDSTIVDDTSLLDMSVEEVLMALDIPKSKFPEGN